VAAGADRRTDRRMTVLGATSSFAKVASSNRQRSLRLVRPNWSSCPTTDLHWTCQRLAGSTRKRTPGYVRGAADRVWNSAIGLATYAGSESLGSDHRRSFLWPIRPLTAQPCRSARSRRRIVCLPPMFFKLVISKGRFGSASGRWSDLSQIRPSQGRRRGQPEAVVLRRSPQSGGCGWRQDHALAGGRWRRSGLISSHIPLISYQTVQFHVEPRLLILEADSRGVSVGVRLGRRDPCAP
jgi:hypothetical protein